MLGADRQRNNRPRHTGTMRVVGLLRGVNLGASRRLRMADLRAAVEALGHVDVETYLQSGNVVFTPAPGTTTGLGAAITDALRERVGLSAAVLTRTGAEMADIVAANPYQREDPTKVVVTFLEAPADAAALEALDLAAFGPEGLTVHGAQIYLDLPFGQGRSPLLHALSKRPAGGGASTSRNWRTVTALAAMSSD
jgi:uncharacterized protein (DUF1697 family)